jgi:CarD family transcriptional regulator
MLKMKSGDLLQVAEVIKSLTARDRKRGLSTGERKLLTCARSNLLSELSMTLEAELKDVEARLDRALK